MDDDQYSSGQSDLQGVHNDDSQLPNPFVAALLIIGISFLVGIVFVAIEFIFNVSVPGNTAISTLIPALVVGSFYGRKRQSYFPRNFRIKVIAIWVAISLIFTFFIFRYLDLPLQEMLPSLSIVVSVSIGILLLVATICYFAFKFGEKIVMDAAKKKSI